MSDDLSLIVGGRVIVGWEEIRVTAGIERMVRDFEISMTERFAGDALPDVIQPGDDCRVLLGDDVVITGWVDRFAPIISARRHSIRVTGRGKCSDLVDCSAEWPSGQISGSNALGIAQKLADPYGIKVAAEGDDTGIIPQFNVQWGETAFQIIERVSRYHALLAYELADGSLLLSRVGTASHASGFTQGINVEAARVVHANDHRFSEYVVRRLSTSVHSDAGSGVGEIVATAIDKGIRRHRVKYMVAESGIIPLNLGQYRADWEAARRFGRSSTLHIRTDSWRDSAGNLWQPNTLVPLDLPAMKIPTGAKWTIAEVTFGRDRDGTHAELTIMPPGAFTPKIEIIQPFLPDVPTVFRSAPR
jgi:prophage tail gpP-like protein